MTSKGRVKDFEDRQRALDRKGRKVWATESEHEQIKNLLVKIRK